MITPPKPLIEAKSGDPIKSEDWNNVLRAIGMIYDALNKRLGSLSIDVKNKANGNPISDAVVTVVPTGDNTRPTLSGIYAGSDIRLYQVSQIPAGSYNVVIEADRFDSETRSITMDESGNPLTLTVEMTATEHLFPVPLLFGKALNVAIDSVEKAEFQVSRIIDSYGKEIAPGAIPKEAKLLKVLGQVPPAGTLVSRNSQVQLHISAKAVFEERVKVPDLAGLTLDEAKAKLKARGLVLGEILYLGK